MGGPFVYIETASMQACALDIPRHTSRNPVDPAGTVLASNSVERSKVGAKPFPRTGATQARIEGEGSFERFYPKRTGLPKRPVWPKPLWRGRVLPGPSVDASAPRSPCDHDSSRRPFPAQSRDARRRCALQVLVSLSIPSKDQNSTDDIPRATDDERRRNEQRTDC
jgi:hypothetical protein